eukprot:2339884-Prymnesium_polylepis.1
MCSPVRLSRAQCPSHRPALARVACSNVLHTAPLAPCRSRIELSPRPLTRTSPRWVLARWWPPTRRLPSTAPPRSPSSRDRSSRRRPRGGQATSARPSYARVTPPSRPPPSRRPQPSRASRGAAATWWGC